MNRREFCLSGVQLGLLTFLPTKLWAQSATPQFFIQIEFPGGWDTSLASDPWTATTRLMRKITLSSIVRMRSCR